jgi:thiamine pyrophosphate-dependent acetolactate synthase large subunit-like protein
MARSRKTPLNRRGFLKGAAVGAAAGATALVTTIPATEAQAPQGGAGTAATGRGGAVAVAAPTQDQLNRDAGNVRPPATARPVNRPGSDLMTQVLKDMGVEYAAANPGSTFEGLQESIINYGNPRNVMPEWITALHEESSVTFGHGYAKAEGKPMVAVLHGTIGVQHAAMSIYQAYHGRVPILIIVGRDNPPLVAQHGAADIAGMVRSFTKWDAQPATLAESLTTLQEAYRQAITPPMGPTIVVLDAELQKEEAGNLAVPAYRPPQFPMVEATRVREIAQGLVNAQNPRIAVGRLRTPQGVRLAVELAELLGATTSTSATGGPMSFPQRHPLQGPGADTNYDYTLGLETGGAQAAITGPSLATITAQRDTARIGFSGIQGAGGGRGGRGGGGGNAITADAEASLPAIIEEVRRLLTADKRRVITERTAKHAAANREDRLRVLRGNVEAARAGWDGTPVATARVYAELWPLIMNEDWCLSSPSNFSGGHHSRLWDHNKPYSYLGGQDAGGMGYGAPASVGAALAAKNRGRIVINVQTDGDLNYAPGVLWTAVHHKLPMLTIMHNNRAWHQELMFVQFMTGVRGRGTDRGHIGSVLRDPPIDYVKMAAAYGMDGIGPISDPKQLAAAFKRGVDSVKKGQPFMIDVITQPR